MALPGLARQSIFSDRVYSLDGCAGIERKTRFALLSAHNEEHNYADDRRRRLPAQRISRRPRRRTDADAVEFAGRYLADVGAADEGADPIIPRHPLRPP